MGGLYYKPTEFTTAIIQNIQLELLSPNDPVDC